MSSPDTIEIPLNSKFGSLQGHDTNFVHYVDDAGQGFTYMKINTDELTTNQVFSRFIPIPE